MALKFALVGCGRIAKRHADLLSEGRIQGAELCAVCDTQTERAQTFGSKYNVPHFANMDEMAEQTRPDVFVVLTPSGYHAENVIHLTRYKKPIVVEKPMALTIADAKAMIAACNEVNVDLFVVKQNRFNLPVVKLREALEAGRFGRLNMGTIRVRWCRNQAYYDQDDWRGTWALDGGVLSNQASHHIDLLQWMLGDVESVYAKGRTFLADIEAEDTGVAILKFKSGAIGVIEATSCIRPVDLEGSLSLLGEKGSVEIGGFAVNCIRHWNFSDHKNDDKNILENFSENPPNVYGFGHKSYLNDVVESLTKGTEHFVTGLEGIKSLEIIVAIYESMETGQEIKFPFTPRLCKLGQKNANPPSARIDSHDENTTHRS